MAMRLGKIENKNDDGWYSINQNSVGGSYGYADQSHGDCNHYTSRNFDDNLDTNELEQFLRFENGLSDLTQEDVEKRSLIFRTLVTHREKFVNSIFQGAVEIGNTGVFEIPINGNLHYINTYPFSAIAPKDQLDLPYSYYVDQGYNNYREFDFIREYAKVKSKTYKDCINEIHAHIEGNASLYSHSQLKSKTLVQERQPIALNLPFTLENFNKISNLRWQFYLYYNIYKNIVGFNIRTKNASIFYTFWRFKDSSMLYLLPIAPEPPYMAYNIVKTLHSENIKILEDEAEVTNYESNGGSEIPAISIPFGIMNLDKLDYSLLKGKQLILPYREKHYEENFLIRLKKVSKENNVKFLFDGQWIQPAPYISLDNLLEQKDFVPSNLKGVTEVAKSAFSGIGEPIKNYDRKRIEIVKPIIESGSITWLFAKEKVGKTLVALSLAYIIGKGHRTLGDWSTSEAKRVLYVDGEMAGDRIHKLCDKIMLGQGESNDCLRPFETYLFAEDDFDYDSILDEEWLGKYKSMLFAYDVVILDNYYSLNENRINVKPFLKLVKEMTSKEIAVIIVDHVNSNGELQGSIVKRRAADIGLRLGEIDENRFSVSYEFDRHGFGIGQNQEFEKVFTSSDFKLVPISKGEENSSKETLSKAELSDRDNKLLYVYLLNSRYNVPQKKIAEILKLDKSTISAYISSVKGQCDDKYVDRNKISNMKLFKEKFEEDKNLTEIEIREKLKIYRK